MKNVYNVHTVFKQKNDAYEYLYPKLQLTCFLCSFSLIPNYMLKKNLNTLLRSVHKKSQISYISRFNMNAGFKRHLNLFYVSGMCSKDINISINDILPSWRSCTNCTSGSEEPCRRLQPYRQATGRFEKFCFWKYFN